MHKIKIPRRALLNTRAANRMSFVRKWTQRTYSTGFEPFWILHRGLLITSDDLWKTICGAEQRVFGLGQPLLGAHTCLLLNLLICLLDLLIWGSPGGKGNVHSAPGKDANFHWITDSLRLERLLMSSSPTANPSPPQHQAVSLGAGFPLHKC